jgi:hypothetical protein
MYDKNIANLKNISMVLNYGVLQHFVQGEKFNPRPFIFHMAGYNVKERVDNFKNYLDRVV